MRGSDRFDPGWVRLATVLLLVASTIQAPLVAGSPTPSEAPWQVATHVNASVVDNYARVNVSAEVTSDAAGGDFLFEVPIPEEAFVTGLAITRNGTTYEADVEPRQQARERYDEARTEGRSAGLVEQTDRDSVYSYQLNVGPNQTVQATLTYETYLVAHEGTYTLPLVAPAASQGQDTGASFAVRLEHGRGLADAWTEPATDVALDDETARLGYEVGPRSSDNASSLDVHYRTHATDRGGRLVATVHNGTGYFAHRLQAASDESRLPIDLSLVLDRSGSMSGAKIEQLKTATRRVVDHLDERDRVHLTTFSQDVAYPWDGFRAVDTELAERLDRRLANVTADGGTNIEGGVRDGFGAFQDRGDADRRLPAVAFLTDGKATAGVQSNDRLREIALETNRADAHVFGLAFGSRADWSLVHGLADDADGYAERVPADKEAELALERFLTRLTSPVLKNVTVSYEQPSVDAWRAGAPVLFSGGELLYAGTFDPNVTRLEATVEAEGVAENVSEDVWAAVEETDGDNLPRLVAYHQVRALEDRIDAQGSNETLEKRALELALEHGFVTERTSLVVDLPRDTPTDDEADADETADAADGEAADRSATSTADRDADGLPAASDACPTSAGTAGNNGCPQDAGGARDRGQQDTSASRDDEAAPETEQTPGPGVIGTLVATIGLALGLRRRSG